MNDLRVVLASASPRRLAVLRQLGVEPEVRPADIDEAPHRGEDPAAYVERLARDKAQSIARERVDTGSSAGPSGEGAPAPPASAPGSLPMGTFVVGGDTVVVLDGRILSKPADRDDAVAMLLSLSGRSHEVLSGLAIVGPRGTECAIGRTRVWMRAFDRATARAYVDTGEPLDKAGGYGIQGLGAALVERIDGDYYSVVGFPVGVFLDLLQRAGGHFSFGVPDPAPRAGR